MPDTSKLKPGDVVHVKGTVTTPSGQGVCVRFETSSPGWFARSDIVHVEPRPLQVGDRVWCSPWNERGEIICIDGTEAWVKRGNFARYTVRLNDLERAEDA